MELVSKSPTEKSVLCPACNARATAVVPKNGSIVDREADADGKVWTNCYECGERFITYFQLDE